MKAGDRKDKIDKLKELEGYDRGILTNARCLAEGVDVPSLDGVAFIDPKGSQVEIIQAVGRAIRKVRGAKVQTKGTIVIPVFIEDGDDHEASIEASNFKPVWDVLKALRAHDEVLAEVLDQYRTNMAKNASQSRENISDKIVFDMPVSVDTEFSSALRTVLVEATTASWEFWYGLLVGYISEHGAATLSAGIVLTDGHKLGKWCDSQRQLFKAQKLSKLRYEKLQALVEHGWSWSINSTFWTENYELLKHYITQQNLSELTVKTEITMNGSTYKIGQWASNQRKRYKNKKLEDDKVRLLEELEGWVWDAKEVVWLEHYEELLRLELPRGRCLGPLKLCHYLLTKGVTENGTETVFG